MSKITLNCIVKENPGSIFHVSIDRKKSVYTLKKTIKKELRHIFMDVDAVSIKLWFVQIGQDDTRLGDLVNNSVEDVFEGTAVYEAQRETSVENYLNHFKNTNDDDIHVIVHGRRIVLPHLRNPM